MPSSHLQSWLASAEADGNEKTARRFSKFHCGSFLVTDTVEGKKLWVDNLGDDVTEDGDLAIDEMEHNDYFQQQCTETETSGSA